ncbi:hypothetical protein EUGRSUZ_G03168 [Eucalyptus grandis]|uniref:Uncharacterized protein n=2 Tax=Eucalyptus grandis TaxID=71139 RepID=A0ACC3K9V2_EUCGR|nr:hypothetical protein EUGRSUZ_G03168 [Eucalyptus grandis]
MCTQNSRQETFESNDRSTRKDGMTVARGNGWWWQMMDNSKGPVELEMAAPWLMPSIILVWFFLLYKCIVALLHRLPL